MEPTVEEVAAARASLRKLAEEAHALSHTLRRWEHAVEGSRGRRRERPGAYLFYQAARWVLAIEEAADSASDILLHLENSR
jgi:hypothetical protein